MQVYKIIILGESNVGKSSLFLRYTQDEFREAIANTIGIDNRYKELIIRDTPVQLQLWDTAGQERFHSIVTAYFRQSDGVVFVYDVGSDRSFDYMADRVAELEGKVDARFAVLVGNKIDTVGDTEDERVRLSALARRHGFKYYFTSAKTGQNVNEMFEELGHALFYNRRKEARPPGSNPLLAKKRRRSRWCL